MELKNFVIFFRVQALRWRDFFVIEIEFGTCGVWVAADRLTKLVIDSSCTICWAPSLHLFHMMGPPLCHHHLLSSHRPLLRKYLIWRVLGWLKLSMLVKILFLHSILPLRYLINYSYVWHCFIFHMQGDLIFGLFSIFELWDLVWLLSSNRFALFRLFYRWHQIFYQFL